MSDTELLTEKKQKTPAFIWSERKKPCEIKMCHYSPSICPESKTSLSREGQVIPLGSLHGVSVTVDVCTCQFATDVNQGLAKDELIHSIILSLLLSTPCLSLI